jgi:hypothetical protein
MQCRKESPFVGSAETKGDGLSFSASSDWHINPCGVCFNPAEGGSIVYTDVNSVWCLKNGTSGSLHEYAFEFELFILIHRASVVTGRSGESVGWLCRE